MTTPKSGEATDCAGCGAAGWQRCLCGMRELEANYDSLRKEVELYRKALEKSFKQLELGDMNDAAITIEEALNQGRGK